MLERSHIFQGLSPEKLAIAASCLQVQEVEAGQEIFDQGQIPNAFYIIYSGRLKVTRYSKKSLQDEMLGFLDEGDFCGHDLFRENRPYQVSVGAISEAILLVLDLPNARDLFARVPELSPRMRMIIDSHALQTQVPLSWVNPEEFVYYIAQKHIVFLWARVLPWLFGTLLILGLLAAVLEVEHMLFVQLFLGTGLAVFLGLMVWNYIDWSNDYYLVTGRRVVFQEKIVFLYDSRLESPLEQIQSMKVDTTFWGRFFHFGDLTIRSFTGTILFRGIRQPQDVM